MGIWGPKLYQDDLAEDIRDAFEDRLKRGKTGKQITEELITEYEEELMDSDNAPVFWFALADIQWEFGCLEEKVKENALYHIQAGSNLRRWELEDSSNLHKRKIVLEELETKLLSPQPPEKKVKKYKLYECEWQIGDVYAYPLDSEYAKENKLDGYYFLFHKISETTYWPGHIIPIVRVKMSKKKELPKDVDEFNALEYVQTSVTRFEEPYSRIRGTSYVRGEISEKHIVDDFGFLPTYRLELINTSKRIIPKNLIYIGNYKEVTPPRLEFVPEDISIPGFIWRFFDRNMIERYCGYNLGQYKIYSERK